MSASELPRVSPTERIIMDLLRSGEMFGLEMVKTDNRLKRGTVYVTLDRMGDKGLLKSRAVENPNEPGMARRYYSLTALGQRVRRSLDAADEEFSTLGGYATP